MELTEDEERLIRRSREVSSLAKDFVHMAYVERRREEAFEKYVAADLIEHNPDFCDGRASSAQFIAARLAGANSEEYLPVSEWRLVFDQVLIHGDLLIMRRHAFQRRKDAGRVFIDFWRWSGDKIVEHWDVIQDVPSAKVNPRTMW